MFNVIDLRCCGAVCIIPGLVMLIAWYKDPTTHFGHIPLIIDEVEGYRMSPPPVAGNYIATIPELNLICAFAQVTNTFLV